MKREQMVCDECGKVVSARWDEKEYGWFHLELDYPREITESENVWDFCSSKCLSTYIHVRGIGQWPT